MKSTVRFSIFHSFDFQLWETRPVGSAGFGFIKVNSSRNGFKKLKPNTIRLIWHRIVMSSFSNLTPPNEIHRLRKAEGQKSRKWVEMLSKNRRFRISNFKIKDSVLRFHLYWLSQWNIQQTEWNLRKSDSFFREFKIKDSVSRFHSKFHLRSILCFHSPQYEGKT